MSTKSLCVAVGFVGMLVGTEAVASTLNQNTSWTLQRTGATQTVRVVGYGDSIYAGYKGSLFSVAKRAAPNVAGEYLSQAWNANVVIIRRAKSGARADDIYNNKIVAERAYMQNTSTRVVTFEMCGNDYLQARSSFAGQTGTCNYSGIASALARCTTYMELGMQAVNLYATTARLKVIANLYYPGFAADNALSQCVDAATGQPVNKQHTLLPYIARSNWRACDLAARYGFVCADSFAEYMAAEYDSDGDGFVDSDAVRFYPGETEASYVQRVSVTYRGLLRDANFHVVDPSTSYDYILSDNVHPNYFGGTIALSIFTGSGSGSGFADFSDAQTVGGKNPQWNKWGHEKMGWAIWSELVP